MKREGQLITVEQIEQTIILLRGQKILLAPTLAQIYGVETKTLTRQVKRNIGRFPSDFVFVLSREEIAQLRSAGILSNNKEGRGGSRYVPYAFTEHGAIMVATVLSTPRAVAASVYVVRAFVKLRQILSSHRELANKLVELEQQVGTHDKAIVSLFSAIRQMMAPPAAVEKKIGFNLTREP
ncbi:MAG: ORF6N domain-containing protein [bacterium]